jgi:hypothetical protein
MTESEWLTCSDPFSMLTFLEGKVGDRKLRLFMSACCRRIWHLLEDERARNAVEVAERFADGLVGEEELLRADDAVDEIVLVGVTLPPAYSAASWVSASPRNNVFSSTGPYFASSAAARAKAADRHPGTEVVTYQAESIEHCRLLREIVGNPFRPVAIDPEWLTWDGGTVPDLARAIDHERAFDRMPILADALEEAGCTDAAILDHCRGPGPHVKGCWALDAILGRD